MDPRPPAWFVKKLKALDPNFDVRWDRSRKQWAILERVRWSTHVATLDGAPVLRRHRRPWPALFVNGLGSRVLDWVKRNDPRRYPSLEAMKEALDIDDKHGLRPRPFAGAPS